MRSKIYLPALSLMLFFPVAGNAEVSLTNIQNPDSMHIIQKNDSLYIDCVLEYDKTLKSGETVEIVPALIAGHNICVLNKVVLNGSQRQKIYKRQLELMSKEERTEVENTVYAGNGFGKKEIVRIPYRIAVPYENWMAESVFRVYESNCFCGENVLKKEIRKRNGAEAADEQVYALVRDYPTNISLERDRFMKAFDPQIAFITPELYELENQKMDYQIHFDYKASQTRLDNTMGENAASFGKLAEQLTALVDDGAQINDIRIRGYASPEGLYATNDRISRERAERFKAELMSRFRLDTEIVHVESTVEDWDGLRNMLVAESPEFADKALAIIDSYGVFQGREKKLMELDGGTSYLYMLEHYFPPLRRVEFRIDYAKQEKTIEDIQVLLSTAPSAVSLNEMNRLLRQCEPGSEAYVRILHQIRMSYPGDETALLNEAALALKAGDLKTGKELMQKKRNRRRYPEYENNQAILLLYEGEDDSAETLLRNAAQTGLPEAAANLKKLLKN